MSISLKHLGGNQNLFFDEFLNDLVGAITGYTIDQLPESKRDHIVLRCRDIFNNFILDYVEAKYDKKDAVRLKSVQIFEDDDIFNKFPDLENKFQDAYNVFVNSLEHK